MPKSFAMSGSAVAITVPSRNSMKNAPATSSAGAEKARPSREEISVLIVSAIGW
jgi:hypothetical protein